MAGPFGLILLILGLLIAIPVAVVVVIYVVVPCFKGLGWLIRQVARFIAGEIGDLFRLIGTIITMIVLTPLVIGSIVIGRWSASAHYGRAFQGEFRSACLCLYRIVIGHPARLLCLTALTEGIEKRVPEVMAAAPGRDTPSGRTGQFPGYTIVGSLAAGGSGGKLFVAEPDEIKRASLTRQGHDDVGQVVIKVFSLRDGSSLPQMFRENRSLEAARRLGLILEHETTEDRFYYVMRYVPGESLGLVAQRLHAESGSEGLRGRGLHKALGYAADLVRTLDTYHRGGLWHKDVKPDNIIVDGSSAHLVDLGLITPLRSAMTLTTHGTEYFRDPEMVRLALKGVKVHEVNGAKFDIYAAGAVLFSIIENSFPAHGGLSQITKPCPEAVRWVVRRAMADYDKRYESTHDMLADLEVILAASDPFAVRPVDLPSVGGEAGQAQPAPATSDPNWVFASAAPASPPRGREGSPPPVDAPRQSRKSRPKIRVTNWWTGAYEIEDEAMEAVNPLSGVPGGAAAARAGSPTPPGARRVPRPLRPRGATGVSAKEQRERARARAQAARARAHTRMASRRKPKAGEYSNNPNVGVGAALVGFAVLMVLGVAAAISFYTFSARSVHVTPPAPPPQPFTSAMDLTGRTIAVLRERITYLPGVIDQVDDALERLQISGASVIGLGPSGAGTQEATEMLASLRSTIGLHPFQSDGARDAIRTWLGEHIDVDMVVWIAPDRGSGSSPDVWVVSADHVASAETTYASRELALKK